LQPDHPRPRRRPRDAARRADRRASPRAPGHRGPVAVRRRASAAARGRARPARRRARPGPATLAFSGYAIDEIRALAGGPDVLARLDVLIDGRYVARERLAIGLRGSANQRIQLLTDRYARRDVEQTPVAEIRIGPTGDVVLTGVDPLKLKQRP
ncbi:MAG TPA: 4Fe-4S cluster-binding domain-containing protein, partial [Kofleriaceae bacterium]|nr:4Fe-4S cluster-binding domain-containing protein [Kofleriaceae bacterium]